MAQGHSPTFAPFFIDDGEGQFVLDVENSSTEWPLRKTMPEHVTYIKARSEIPLRDFYRMYS